MAAAPPTTMPTLEDCLPLYPPRYTHKQVSAWVLSAYTSKPALPGVDGPPPADLRIQRLVERYVSDREHREQLKAWARSQGSEASFRAACILRQWDRGTAQRHVDKALAMLLLVMNALE